MRHLFVAALFILASISTFAQAKADEAALADLTSEMANAQVAYDQIAFERIYAADFIEVSPVGEVDSRAKVIAFYDRRPGNGPQEVEVSEVSIRSYGPTAVVIAKLTYKFPVAAQAPPRSMRVTLVCRKDKAVWKITSAHYTGIRPPQPPKS